MMSLDDDDWAKNEFCSCKHELGHHIHIRTRSKDDWAAVSFTVDPCTRCSCSFFQPVDSNNDKLREIVENLRRPLAERSG